MTENDDIALIVYSHTDYSDIWPMFFGQAEKFLKKFKKKYLFVNEEIEGIPKDFKVCLYSDSDCYRDRIAMCCDQIEEDFLIFQHEDMPLISEPAVEILENWSVILENEENFDFVKLLRGGVPEGQTEKFDDGEIIGYLNIIPKTADYIFAIQPTLWKTETFQQIHEECSGETIWEFENRTQEFCRLQGINGLFSWFDEPKRGKYHYDSEVWPFVATAVTKGKWNSEYKEELMKLMEEFGINPEIRGWS